MQLDNLTNSGDDNIVDKSMSAGLNTTPNNGAEAPDFQAIVLKSRTNEESSQMNTNFSQYKELQLACDARSKCQILQEPEMCPTSNIWSLEQEYQVLKDQNLMDEPLEIYLNYCQRYAR